MTVYFTRPSEFLSDIKFPIIWIFQKFLYQKNLFIYGTWYRFTRLTKWWKILNYIMLYMKFLSEIHLIVSFGNIFDIPKLVN